MTEAPKVRQCPICRKPMDQAYRPFCSKRCADIDLGRWFNGTYAVPAEEEPMVGDDGRDDGEANGGEVVPFPRRST
jgi:uncharacterized protein